MTGVMAVIPVRSFASGMSRLAPVLTEDRRVALGVTLARRVLDCARKTGMEPLVVTSDTEVASLASAGGAGVVPDPGRGLDDACRAGTAQADEAGLRWVVIHSDLPLLTPGDLEVMLRWVHEGRDVIAPSSDGGTSALSSRAPVDFAYGPASFHRHLALLSNPVIVARRGFLHDLDTTDDLASAIGVGVVRG